MSTCLNSQSESSGSSASDGSHILATKLPVIRLQNFFLGYSPHVSEPMSRTPKSPTPRFHSTNRNGWLLSPRSWQQHETPAHSQCSHLLRHESKELMVLVDPYMNQYEPPIWEKSPAMVELMVFRTRTTSRHLAACVFSKLFRASSISARILEIGGAPSDSGSQGLPGCKLHFSAAKVTERCSFSMGHYFNYEA